VSCRSGCPYFCTAYSYDQTRSLCSRNFRFDKEYGPNRNLHPTRYRLPCSSMRS